MRQGSILISACSAAIAASSVLLMHATTEQAEAAVYAETPAVSCRAGNSTSAGLLQWDHIRVWNPTSMQLWVVCPVTNNTEVYNASGEFHLYGPGSGTLTAWFDSTAAPTASVRCTWLDLEASVTGTSVTNSVTRTISAPATLPGVKSQGFDLTTFNAYQPGTITCRLDPHTGLNSYLMNINKEII